MRRGDGSEHMAGHGFYYDLNEFQATRTTRRWWPKAIATCAVLGGIYGAAVGSTISTTPGAADVIGIVALVVAVLCGIPGVRLGRLIGILSQVRFRRFFPGFFAAAGGAFLGGLLGLLAMAPLGTILGAVGGWLVAPVILRRGVLAILGGRLLGLVLGACLGATFLALSQTSAKALVGITWGLGIGAVVGPLPLLLFVKMLDALAARRHPDGEVIDVKVVDAPSGEDRRQPGERGDGESRPGV
jgi:hypothetical protein